MPIFFVIFNDCLRKRQKVTKSQTQLMESVFLNCNIFHIFVYIQSKIWWLINENMIPNEKYSVSKNRCEKSTLKICFWNFVCCSLQISQAELKRTSRNKPIDNYIKLPLNKLTLFGLKICFSSKLIMNIYKHIIQTESRLIP